MAKNFFDLLGYSSDELADTMPEKIVQAFHDKGKDGVRVLMYEEMSKRLKAPLHIHSCNSNGVPNSTPDIYGEDQPGEPVKLIRDVTDLYRRYGEPASSPERGSPEPAAAPAGGGASRKRTGGGGGGGGGGSKATGPDAWEKRFQDLADFVAKRGHRPRRTATEDAERHLHYWMGQQQRKLGHNELPRDQADKLEELLARTKGKKVEGGGGGGGGGSRKAGSSSRRKRAAAGEDDTAMNQATGGDEGEGDEGEGNDEEEQQQQEEDE